MPPTDRHEPAGGEGAEEASPAPAAGRPRATAGTGHEVGLTAGSVQRVLLNSRLGRRLTEIGLDDMVAFAAEVGSSWSVIAVVAG